MFPNELIYKEAARTYYHDYFEDFGKEGTSLNSNDCDEQLNNNSLTF